MGPFKRKQGVAWKSTKKQGGNEGAERLAKAFAQGGSHIRAQVRTIFSSETGRLLVLGDIVLELVSTPVGRIVTAVGALTGAYYLI